MDRELKGNSNEDIIVQHLDHLVLTVRNIEETVLFYERVLGMKSVVFSQGRIGLKFGNQRINLHKAGHVFHPAAKNAGPGTADLCFLTNLELAQAIAHVENQGVKIIEGPVKKTRGLWSASFILF